MITIIFKWGQQSEIGGRRGTLTWKLRLLALLKHLEDLPLLHSCSRVNTQPGLLARQPALPALLPSARVTRVLLIMALVCFFLKSRNIPVYLQPPHSFARVFLYVSKLGSLF